MKKEYRIELTVVVDDANRQCLIDVARRCLPPEGRLTFGENQIEKLIPPEECVENVAEALSDLIYEHPAFEEAQVEIREMSCTMDESATEFPEPSCSEGVELVLAHGGAEQIVPEDDELDRYDTGMYVCRWPNGEFSIVAAASKREAIIALDDWGGAHPSQVHPIDSFMADFRLDNKGEICLKQFGEMTGNVVWDTCYPALRDLFTSSDLAKLGWKKRLRTAVDYERTRLWDHQPADEPATELGRRIARQLGTSAVVADHYAEEVLKRILESYDGEDGEPN